MDANTVQIISGIGSIVLGFGLLTAAIAGVAVSYRMYRMGTDPSVIAYPTLLNDQMFFVIENTGRGMAFGVIVKSNKPLPPSSMLREPELEIANPSRSRSIGAIAPGERRVFELAIPGTDTTELLHDTCVTVEYSNKYRSVGRKFTGDFPVSSATFLNARIAESVNPQVRLAAATEKVAKSNYEVANRISKHAGYGIAS